MRKTRLKGTDQILFNMATKSTASKRNSGCPFHSVWYKERNARKDSLYTGSYRTTDRFKNNIIISHRVLLIFMYTPLFSLKNSVSLSICQTYYYLITYVDYIDI